MAGTLPGGLHADIQENMKELTTAWPQAKSFGQVHNITVRDGKVTSELRYFLSSLPVGVKRFGGVVRRHWGIENSLHGVLDVTLTKTKVGFEKGGVPTAWRC
ncbi:MAG: hypothetical protein MUC43_13470 [Pirellula sp.]|jgi:predicted transposase YbfD/YdcC|nr:hypothetical protein [Pirellula sp.]